MPVPWQTVAALTSAALPSRQTANLCLDPECDVVYFGDRGLDVRTTDVNTVPGFKLSGSGLTCYCFLRYQSEIEEEVEETGVSAIAASIRSRVKNRSCACEVRNPNGRCCLPEIERIVVQATGEKRP